MPTSTFNLSLSAEATSTTSNSCSKMVLLMCEQGTATLGPSYRVQIDLKSTCGHFCSSRLGYLDLGVNAKRFNWFALWLGRLPGWKTTPITQRGHENYFALNGLTDDDVT